MDYSSFAQYFAGLCGTIFLEVMAKKRFCIVCVQLLQIFSNWLQIFRKVRFRPMQNHPKISLNSVQYFGSYGILKISKFWAKKIFSIFFLQLPKVFMNWSTFHNKLISIVIFEILMLLFQWKIVEITKKAKNSTFLAMCQNYTVRLCVSSLDVSSTLVLPNIQ